MQKFLKLGDIDWYHETAPTKEIFDEIGERFNVHELVQEDISEPTTQDKIDVYDDHMFIVLHFPKYRTEREKYINNEFNIIMGKKYIITLSKYPTNHIEKIKANYEKEMAELAGGVEDYKTSPYYILYRIIDVMYDKVLRGTAMFSRDLNQMEDHIFEEQQMNKELLEKIMIKRRNVVALKHTLLPQHEILEELQEETLKFFGGELDVYFVDLEYKLDKITGIINILKEDIESLYDTYNAIVNMKINTIVAVLTIFTVVLGVMTLITGFYGMNVTLPGEDNTQMFLYILLGMLAIAGSMTLFFRYKKWI